MDSDDKNVQKVREYIASRIKLLREKDELRQMREERFRSAMGMRLKTPKKPDSPA